MGNDYEWIQIYFGDDKNILQLIAVMSEELCEYTKKNIKFYTLGFPGGSGVKDPHIIAGAAGATGLIPRSGRSPGVGNGNPLQYCCQDDPMDRGAWQAIVHRVTKRQT